MYKYRITTIKSSAVEWYQKDPILEQYLEDTYRIPEKMSSAIIVEESTDDTDVLVKEVTFIDQATWQEFRSDPMVELYLDNRRTYENEHSIIRFREDIY